MQMSYSHCLNEGLSKEHLTSALLREKFMSCAHDVDVRKEQILELGYVTQETVRVCARVCKLCVLVLFLTGGAVAYAT